MPGASLLTQLTRLLCLCFGGGYYRLTVPHKVLVLSLSHLKQPNMLAVVTPPLVPYICLEGCTLQLHLCPETFQVRNIP